MEYYQGDLILSDEDKTVLELVTMKRIKQQYLASYFIGSMREIKSQAVERIEEIKSASYIDECALVQLELMH